MFLLQRESDNEAIMAGDKQGKEFCFYRLFCVLVQERTIWCYRGERRSLLEQCPQGGKRRWDLEGLAKEQGTVRR